MKKLFLLFAFIVGIFTATVQAQSLNFEETVQYINDKIHCCSDYSEYSISATKNGNVIMTRGNIEYLKFNLFTIENNSKRDYSAFGSYKEIEYYKGITFSSSVIDSKIEYSINIEGFTRAFIPIIQNEDIGNKLMKAFKHLHSLCIKEKDPFDN